DLPSVLRSRHDAGAARSTVSRKSAAVRSFFAYAASRLGLTNNADARLRTPTKDSRLPTVLKPQQAADLIPAAEAERPAPAEGDDDPLEAAKRLRDAAILEMLYATAVRVSELTELDRSDVDHRSAMIT